MSAHPASPAKQNPKKYVPAERRLSRSDDPETALGLQLRSLVERLEVDALLVCDLDGAAIASAWSESAGEVEAIALAEFAAATVKERFGAHAVTTTRGFVHVDLVDARGRTFVLAAFAKTSIPAPVAVARAVAGAARILQGGLAIGAETALPLRARGWGDWEIG